MKLATSSTWMRLFMATPLVLNIFAVVLPKPESTLTLRGLTAHAAVIRDDFFRRGAGDGLADNTLDDASPFELSAFKGDGTTGKKRSSDETTDLNEEVEKETVTGGETKPLNENKTQDKTTNLNEENEFPSGEVTTKASRKPKAQVRPETHITAIEAAKGGKVVHSGQETFSAAKPDKKKTNEFGADDPCFRFPESTEVNFVGTISANIITGNLHDVSEALCPSGTISHSYTFSTTWSLSGQAGPDLKDLIPKSGPLGRNLDKFGVRFGVTYSWTNSQTTTYSASEAGAQKHPFVLTYKPQVMVVKGDIQKVTYVHPFKERFDCSVEKFNQVEMHIPLHTNDDCGSRATACGPSGFWDHCFFIGAFAREICPGRDLGPTPEPGRQCPVSFYPPEYLDGQGGIKG